MRRRLAVIAALCAVVTAAPGCGDRDITGTYVATTFTILQTGSTTPTNVLTAGGSLTITLEDNGATTGSLNVPASVTGGAPFTASMAGTWSESITSNTVQFDQAADTFVRDLTFAIGGGVLTAAGSFTGGTITVVLTRS